MNMNVQDSRVKKDVVKTLPNREKVQNRPTRPQNVTVALRLVRMGMLVFPVHTRIERNGIIECSCDQRRRKRALRKGIPFQPCFNIGKHPTEYDGLYCATTDELQIREWWKDRPNANIGVLCGEAGGFFVLDLDGPLAFEWLDAMEIEHGPLPVTWETITGSGGSHIYFRYPAGLDIRNSASRIAPKVDIRGNGGYVLAPGSLHRSGNFYRAVNGCAPHEVELADAPSWLIELILAASAKKAPTPRTGGTRSRRIVRGRGWKRLLGMIGDDPGQEGFHSPIYRTACSFFGIAGADADEMELVLALEEAIAGAPVATSRENYFRYTDPTYLSVRIEEAREFVIINPRGSRRGR